MLAVGEHEYGELSDQAVKMSNAFCGGVASSREELCGALSAGMMVIGMRYGRVTADVGDKASLAAAAELRNRFIEHFGTSQCGPIRELRGDCGWVVEDTSRLVFDVLKDDWEAKVSSNP